MSSAHCKYHHQVLPQDQLRYLMDLILTHAEDMDFAVTKYTLTRSSRLVTDDFNAKFEGTCIPGSDELESKKTAKMLSCALMENKSKLQEELSVASAAFWAVKEDDMSRRWRRRGAISS